MRIVGRRTLPPVGLRGPTPDEVRASIDAARLAPRLIPKGVHRYRSHAEANAAMDRWIVQGVVERADELRRSSVTDAVPGRRPMQRVIGIIARFLASDRGL